MGERLIVAAEFIQNGSATIPSFGDVRISGQSMRQALECFSRPVQ
jgi:hypothetical protein